MLLMSLTPAGPCFPIGYINIGAPTLTSLSFLVPLTRNKTGSMDLGNGVAANEALLENIFVLLVSVLNSIPIFVVGKPGSSKSLAVSILLANLRGKTSTNPFLRSFPALESFFHQCSPQSTSQGILQASKHETNGSAVYPCRY